MPTSSDDTGKGSHPRVRISERVRRLTLTELQAECVRRKLKTKGILPTLQQRLQQDMDAEIARGARTIATVGSSATGSLGERCRGPVQHSDGETSRVEARVAEGNATMPRDRDTTGPPPPGGAARPQTFEASVPLPMRESTLLRPLSSDREDTDVSPARGAARRQRASRGRSGGRDAEKRALLERGRIIDMWKVQPYAGGDSAGAMRFVEEIENGHQSMPIPEEDLLAHLPLLLTGPARIWYRNHRDSCDTWENFAEALMERFADPAMDRQLRDEARARRQGPNESVSSYLSCVREYYARLSPPWGMSEQLDTAHGGLWPELQCAVPRCRFASFEEMERRLRGYEASIVTSRLPQVPQPVGKIIYPELQAPQAAQPGKTVSYAGDTADKGGPRSFGNGATSDTTAGRPRGESTGEWRWVNFASENSSQGDAAGSAPRDVPRPRQDASPPREVETRGDDRWTTRDRSRGRSRERRSRPPPRESTPQQRPGASEGSSPKIEALLETLISRVDRLECRGTNREQGGAGGPRSQGRDYRPRATARTRQRPGSCFACKEAGHLARECPRVVRPQGPQGPSATGNEERRG